MRDLRGTAIALAFLLVTVTALPTAQASPEPEPDVEPCDLATVPGVCQPCPQQGICGISPAEIVETLVCETTQPSLCS